MRRLRLAMIRCARWVGPVVVLAVAIGGVGLGYHIARDWHRHGAFSAGFFHLHFHVGDHEHDAHGHHHPSAPADHDHETPGDHSQQRTAVLTVSQSAQNFAFAAPDVASPVMLRGRIPVKKLTLVRTTDPHELSEARAPPAAIPFRVF